MNQQKPSWTLPGTDAASMTKSLGLFNQVEKFTPQVAFWTRGQKWGVVFLYLRILLLIIPPKQ